MGEHLGTNVLDVIDAHPITTSYRHWWSKADLTCACGWTDRRWPKFIVWARADHWAAVAGIRKFRSLADIRAGRG